MVSMVNGGVSVGVLVAVGSMTCVWVAVGTGVSVAVGTLVGSGVSTGINVGELVAVGVSEGVAVGVTVAVLVGPGTNSVFVVVGVGCSVGELVTELDAVTVGVEIGLDARSWATLTIKYPAQ